MKNNNLPEYIYGIPTAKHRSKERRDLIEYYYSNLWKKLQREDKRNMIFNDYLGVNVYIVENESDKKTINSASRNWQSTYAVKYLEKIVRYAVGEEDKPIYDKVKKGTQSYNGYWNMAILYYNFVNNEQECLNFKVKLTIGIKANGKHVQYCVNKIEAK